MSEPPQGTTRSARLLLAVLTVAALALIALYLTIGVRAGWSFTIPFRGRRVAAMVLTGVAISASTVAFQTLAANRILTPSILGFDALYQAIQTAAAFTLGTVGVANLGAVPTFAVSLTIMLAASLALFFGLFGGARRSLHLVLLIGIVLGTMLRALTGLLQRMLDPDTFIVLQSRLFASFSGVDPLLLKVAAGIVVAAVVALYAMRRRLDVLALGRDTATSLGLDYRRNTLAVIALVSLLVATATALVGPITFFGLLVANLAYGLARTHRHAVTIPVAALLSIIVLVGGQTILEHALGQATVLSVVVEIAGGITFLAMLIMEGRRRV